MDIKKLPNGVLVDYYSSWVKFWHYDPMGIQPDTEGFDYNELRDEIDRRLDIAEKHDFE